MELAYVSSGVQGQQAGYRANKVAYFDMRFYQQGLSPVTMDHHNALYDLLMFPLLHEKGVGGYFYGKDGNSVESTPGAKLSLQQHGCCWHHVPARWLFFAPAAGLARCLCMALKRWGWTACMWAASSSQNVCARLPR